MASSPEIETNRELIELAYDRIRSTVDRLFIAFFVVLVAIAAGLLLLRYAEAERNGRLNTENLADVLAESVTIRLGAVDGALFKVSATTRRIGGPTGPAREWNELLRTATAGVSGVSSLFILDVDGIVAHSTLQLIRGLSWADRPIFQQLAKGVPNQLIVDLPIGLVAGSNVLIPFARGLTGPRGEFVGAVIATLLPNQLQDFLGSFDLGTSGVAWILLPSGQALFSEGAQTDRDQATANAPPPFVTGSSIAGDGFVKGAVEQGGPEYMTAYRQIDIADLVVAVSLAESDFVGRWRYEAVGVLILIVVFGALLFVAARRIKTVVLDSLADTQAEEAAESDVIAPTPATQNA